MYKQNENNYLNCMHQLCAGHSEYILILAKMKWTKYRLHKNVQKWPCPSD